MAFKQPIKLSPEQSKAVIPSRHISLRASAGTGKTQVLSSRVFRLLLDNRARPDSILCLTFTKAGASEMANRINRDLARWVQMDEVELAAHLSAIGASITPDNLLYARQLFARVLDAPNGGIQVQTIHSFCQSLLGSFPMEAGIMPGFKAMEDNEAVDLASKTLSHLLDMAKANGDGATLSAMEKMVQKIADKDNILRFLMKAAGNESLKKLDRDTLAGKIMAFNFGRADFALSDLEGEFKDDNLPMDLLNALDSALLAWGAPTAKNMQANLSTWRGFSPKERMDNLDILGQAFLTQKGEISRLNNISKNTPNYENIATDLQTALNDWQGKIGFFHILQDYCEIMGLAADFARDFSEAKSQRGLMDFDDLISQTAALLNQDYMADWVRYKI